MLSLAGTNEPTAAEQLFLAEINQARANPAAEGQRLVSLAQSDPVLQVATSGWNMNAFLTEISAIPPEPPLAFNTGLIEAARAHSASMLAQNLQFHSPSGYLTNPSVATAGNGQPYYPTGYGNWATGENIFAYSGTVNSANLSDYVNYFAAAFLIDWGNPDFGHLTNELAPGPGQWNASNPHYPFSEIGIGLLSNVSSPNATSTGPNVGPAIATEEFGWRAGNPILTGVFYNDNDGSGRYGIGEGIGGVTIRAVGRSSPQLGRRAGIPCRCPRGVTPLRRAEEACRRPCPKPSHSAKTMSSGMVPFGALRPTNPSRGTTPATAKASWRSIGLRQANGSSMAIPRRLILAVSAVSTSPSQETTMRADRPNSRSTVRPRRSGLSCGPTE